MHDIDRNLLEYESEGGNYEYENEFEYEDEFEYGAEFEAEDEYEAEYYDQEVFNESEVESLAAELLGVTDDQELEQFLGKLIRRVGKKARRFVKSKAGKALGGILKGAAKKALPIIGGSVGTAFGGPAGAAIGSKLGSAAGRIFGLELEGLSPEDQEFEVAKQMVRLAGDATKQVTKTQDRMPPANAAKAAVAAAAKRHAPGLLKSNAMSVPRSHAIPGKHSGRWIRRGSKVVLMGI